MIFRTPNGVTGGQGTPPAVSPNRKPWAGEPEQTVQRASLRGQSTQSEGLGQASSLALSPAISAPASTAFPSAWKKGGAGGFVLPTPTGSSRAAGRQTLLLCSWGEEWPLLCGGLGGGACYQDGGVQGACQVSPWSQAGVEGTPVGI